MSENKKSILAETLEDITTVRQQIEENAHFALTSTLKEELSEIIREGLADDISSDDENTEDVTGDDAPVDSNPLGDAPATDDVTASLDEPAGLPGEEGEEEVIDLTGATADEVIGSFKLMAPTDEIEIVKTETGIALNIAGQEGAEDSIAANTEIPGEEPTPGAEETPAVEPASDELPAEDSEEEKDEEALFEIEITEDESEEAPVEEAMSHHVGMKQRNIAHNGNDPLRVEEGAEATEEETVTETEEEKVEEVNESKQKLVAARKKITALTLENAKLKAEMNTINENVETFKTSEDEYKQAISKLKNQLQEVALFTSSLTYAVKLMTENTTTKDEKIQILKRLDSAKSINESRETFKVLNESLKAGKTAGASQIIETKILNADKASGASKINETKVYTNPGVERIKEIIGKIS